MVTDIFLDQKRLNVCKITVKMAPHESFGKAPPEWLQDRKTGGMEGKWHLNCLRLIPGLGLGDITN